MYMGCLDQSWAAPGPPEGTPTCLGNENVFYLTPAAEMCRTPRCPRPHPVWLTDPKTVAEPHRFRRVPALAASGGHDGSRRGAEVGRGPGRGGAGGHGRRQ